MRVAVTEASKIAVYLEIASMSKQSALFCPKGSKTNTPVFLKHLKGEVFEVKASQQLPSLSGDLVVRVFTMQYKFPVRLQEKDRNFLFKQPLRLAVYDPRRCVRIPLAPRIKEELVFTAAEVIPGGEIVLEKGVILDISANGVSFKLLSGGLFFKSGDMIKINYQVFGLTIEALAKIVVINKLIYRCHMVKIDRSQQEKLNKIINGKLDWLTETHYTELKAVIEAAHKLKNLEKEHKLADARDMEHQGKEHFLELVNPILDSVVHVFTTFLDISPKKKDVKLQRISSALYDLSAEITFKAEDFEGSLFLCLKETTLFPIIEKVLGTPTHEITDDVKDLMGEVTNMIIGNAKANLPPSHYFKMSTPTIISGKEHMVSVFSQYTVIRIGFTSELGPFDVNLYVDDIHTQLESADNNFKKFEEFMYDPRVVDPLLGSCERIFREFLGFEIRKKGVTLKETLAPKFELSALINVFTEDIRGKIFLNMSHKLAFAVHEKLLGETKGEVDEAIQDTLSELVNIITGNAKAEYSKLGLVYRLSIPYVIQGRNQIISSSGRVPFISSIYWTSMGLFEICTSFKKI